MNTAIVDIGSNAIKYKIFDDKFNVVEYYRHPLRLGRDVFKNGSLQESTIKKVVKLLTSYLEIFLDQGIDYYFIATSALRDCENSSELLSELINKNIHVNIISGDTEASLLSELNKDIENSAVIDIGGGSVELCINKKNKIYTKSFQLGAVRLLNLTQEKKIKALDELRNWLKQFAKIDHLYGLGGNLKALMAVNQLKDVLTTKNFKTYTQNYLSVPTNELITTYKIPQDRVDIIPEALKLYEVIIDELAADTIEYSFWSISDGLAKKIITDQ